MSTHASENDDGHQRLQDGVSEDERWSLIKMVNLQVSRLQDGCSGDETRAAWATSSESSKGNSEKPRPGHELAAAVHGKTGRPAQELNHVNLVQELLALRETASRVNVAHHLWRHTTGGQEAATVSSSHAQLETANAMSAAAPSALTRHARVNEGSSSTADATDDAQKHAKLAAEPGLALSLDFPLPVVCAGTRPEQADANLKASDASRTIRDLTPPRLLQLQAVSRANAVLSREGEQGTRMSGDAAWPLEHVSEERHNNNIFVAQLLATALSREGGRDAARSISPEFRRPSPRALPPSPPCVRARSPARASPRSPLSPSFSSRSLSPVTRKVTPHAARNESMSPTRFLQLSQRSTISSAIKQQTPTGSRPRWRP